jgi:hypothetical protein
MDQPCNCCGSEDHSMMGIEQDENDNFITILTCPIIEIPKGATIKEQMKQNHLRYRINGYTLALYYGFNTEEVNKALDSFCKNGSGRVLPSYYMDIYKQNVIEICENERASWTFKRLSIGNDSNTEYDL